MRNLFIFFVLLILGTPAFGIPQIADTSSGNPQLIDTSLSNEIRMDTIIPIKPYHLNRVTISCIIGAGLISDIFAIPRIKGKAPLTDKELEALNPGIMTRIDRWALMQNPKDRYLLKQISDIGQIPIFLLPGFLLLDKNIRKDWLDLLLMYAQGHTLTFSFYNYSFLGPTFQNRYRPMTYYDYFTPDERKNGNNRNSFYSGHVASCAFSTFFMTKVYCDYHPDLGNIKYLLYTAAAIPPVWMGYMRIKSLDHFASDDAVGLLLGAVIGIVIPELHKYPCNKNVSVGMFNAPEAMGVSVKLAL